MTELLPPNTFPEFYHFQRFRYDWHLIFYPHGSKDYFSSGKEAAHSAREGKVRDFLIRLQRRLGLRQREMLFFASTEFGNFGTGHIHALSRITSKCTTCNHFKVHHFGWVFSAGLRGWLAR
jgi:hypothetical protein